MSGIFDEDSADPLTQLRVDCLENSTQVRQMYEAFQECEERVTSKSYTAETCEQEVVDLMQALDKCVGKRLFQQLV
ncbi:uncharacterized protein LOC121737819 [Aricia agestis]|uniref:uncharacterized protein LOC121737819 n=1 Tax=Aricia agestis TaxID=91739 RepID=UPI001C20AC20|nr:uncharacterized protein LOC121737819 [Aricia agestis]